MFKNYESRRHTGKWSYIAPRINVGTNGGVVSFTFQPSHSRTPTEWVSQVGPTADVNIVEKETSLPLSEFETRFSGHPFRRLVAVLSVLSLFINVCISKLRNRQTQTALRKSKIGKVEHIFSNAILVTLHTVQYKSYYLQTDPSLCIYEYNGWKILTESSYLPKCFGDGHHHPQGRQPHGP